ncbi:MAG: universal stress protein [Propionibacteriaceae bacterium]
MNTAQHNIAVGVDESPQAMVAARYALWQAELRGLGLTLVHAYPVPAMEAMAFEDISVSLREAAQEVVDTVIAELNVPPTVKVTTLLGQTSPVLLLRQAAETAQLLVVGQDHVGFAERIIVGNIAAPLCHRASCPVIVVPSGWEHGAMNRHPVAVALDGKSATEEVLRVAFEVAVLLKTRLVAVHAMSANSWPRDVAAEERNLAELLAGHKQDNPEVDVTVQTVSGDPKRALVESSLTASLLVVGAPHSEGLAAWTRSVARGVLEQVECPVAVVPRHPSETHERRSADDRDGSLART